MSQQRVDLFTIRKLDFIQLIYAFIPHANYLDLNSNNGTSCTVEQAYRLWFECWRFPAVSPVEIQRAALAIPAHQRNRVRDILIDIAEQEFHAALQSGRQFPEWVVTNQIERRFASL